MTTPNNERRVVIARNHDGYGKCSGTGRVWVDDGQASNWYEGGSCDACRSFAEKLRALPPLPPRGEEPVAWRIRTHRKDGTWSSWWIPACDPHKMDFSDAYGVEIQGLAPIDTPATAEAQARLEALAVDVLSNIAYGYGPDFTGDDAVTMQNAARKFFETIDPAALLSGSTPKPAGVEDALPDDVVRLVVTAREVFDCFLPEDEEETDRAQALDEALEAFASAVPYGENP